MPLSVLVTNEPPETDNNVDQSLLQLFKEYARRTESGQVYPLFRHQAEVFRLIANDSEVLLVAGTAAGKTLAIAVPLFHKLKEGRIRKVVFMYPTIALMEDQRRVMDVLADITGLEVSQIQGGIPRGKLITALNKPVILATPDAVYWFFRKNVKYSGLLVYGLALVDEFILDEAHLFNGLMLRNFELLWQRLKILANSLNNTPRLHIITATPTAELQRLNGGVPTFGRSKCHDVEIEFRPSGRFDRAEQFEVAVNESLSAGRGKVLVVCNSARMAHQLFEKYKVSETSRISVDHRLRFGKVKLGPLNKWLDKAGLGKNLIDDLNRRVLREGDVALADIPEGTEIKLSLEDVIAHTSEILERQCWQVKRALWERMEHPGETWESLLKNRFLPCRIVAALHCRLDQAMDVSRQRAVVDEWVAETVEKLGNIPVDPIPCYASAFTGLTDAFVAAGLDITVAPVLTKRLLFQMPADPAQVSAQRLSHRPIYLRWLDAIVGKAISNEFREAVRVGLASGELDAECRHIGRWKGTDVPIIVYSGSMAWHAREGIIQVFSDLERAVLISTSAVEVGVDFHADMLITEECEGNSFLQRFGRVGRRTTGSKIIAFVSGDTHAALDKLNTAPLTRETFSMKILEVFACRQYAVGSDLLDAHHYLINEQLGRLGRQLNALSNLADARAIAEQLRIANIQLGYGLRSTLPQIGLRDGITKNPFDVLRYVDDQDLRLTDSPFEMARAVTWFTKLIFQSRQFEVIVDLDETLQASQHVFIWNKNKLQVWSHPSAGWVYIQSMNDHFGRDNGWDRWQPGNFILLHGDVYLARVDRGVPHLEPIRDVEQNRLFIPNQTYLVLWGWTDVEETRALLKQAEIADWEELHYDWDRLKQNLNLHAMVILENTTGACFAAYTRLLDHVNCKVQK